MLHLDQVSVHDNFFALGGHSLLATQVMSRIGRRLHVELPLRDLFHAATIAELAECVVAARSGGVAAQQPIPLAPRDGQLLPSFTQEALWFLDQLEQGQPTYTAYPTLRIRGPLDVPVLDRALNEIWRRHEAIRTRFPEVDGRPTAVIEPPTPRPLPLVDLSSLPDAERQASLRAWITRETQRPIDLQDGPLIRITLIKLSHSEHVLVAAAHHMIYDGWSLGIMTRELAALYMAYREGRPSPLPELPIQYADFAAWQRQYLQGESLNRLQSYWVEQLHNLSPMDLPVDRPRPAIRTTRGETLPCNLSPELSAAVREFCRREGVTPFMTLLAAFEVLLQRYSGQEDFAVGSPVANRMRPETEPLIGYFINMVVLRADLSGDPGFCEVVHRVRQTAIAAYEHQELTLDRVVDALKPQRDASRHPLFQVMCVLQNTEPASLDALGLEIEPFAQVSTAETAYFELSLSLEETPQGFLGGLNFNTDLFQAETIRRMAGHFSTLLAEVIADPDRPLSAARLLADDERSRLLNEWSGGRSDLPQDLDVCDLFDAQAKRTPDAVALIAGPRHWTYRELHQRANQLAHHLKTRGVRPDQVVAVRLPRSAELIIALWAVLKSGGAYLPLDPHLPAERLRFTLDDAGVDVVITQETLQHDLPAGPQHVICIDAHRAEIDACPTTSPSHQGASNRLAYVIYTSGSTGQPKGVMIDHRALLNYTLAATAEYGITASDRVLQFTSVSYDAHVEEVYPCLTRGGTLVLRSDDMLDCKRFLDLCHQWQLTFVTLPSGFWHELTDAIQNERLSVPETLRMVVIGGEQALPERIATWFDCVGDRVRLLNTYGPTETTVVATSAEFAGLMAASSTCRLGVRCPTTGLTCWIATCSRYLSAFAANYTSAAKAWPAAI